MGRWKGERTRSRREVGNQRQRRSDTAQREREAGVDLNRVTAASPAGCGAEAALQPETSGEVQLYFPSEWNPGP